MTNTGRNESYPVEVQETNRRRADRFIVSGIQLFASDNEQLLGEVVNLSTSGILLQGEEYIEPGQELKFQLRFPSSVVDEPKVEVEVYTVWSDAQPDGLFKTGLMVEAHPEHEALFARAINVLAD